MGESASEGFRIEDRAAFERLFRSKYSSLCGYANTFLNDADASEEIVQEVMFTLWIKREQLVINTSIDSYLYRAVRNSCLNVMKHLDVRDEHKSWTRLQGSESGETPEEGMIASELEAKIREAIDRLPLERRKIFILSRYESLTYAEIAAKLGISVKTVENQMGKALKTLREELSDYLPGLIVFLMEVFYHAHL